MAGVLEQVSQMMNQGIPEQEIVARLRQQNVSPREINDALDQAQIKSAVSDTGYGNPGEGMQPSVMSEGQASSAPASLQDAYTPPTPQQGTYSQQGYPPQDYYQGDEGGGYGYDDYGGYGGYDGYDAGTASGTTDTMIEVAEQVFSEKIKKIQKQVEEINEFKTLAQTKLDNSIDRLKKIETTMDKLQVAILDKVGSYGKNLDEIKKEMSMMQDSFGKIVKGIAEGKHHTSTTTHKKTSSRKKR